MRFRVMSDLHLNWSQLEIPSLDDDENTVLLLPGDICEVVRGKDTYKEFFENAALQFKMVLYTFGNHEYYGDSYLKAKDHFLRQCGHIDNLKILDLDTVEFDDVAVIGCTLWTDMNKGDPLLIEDAKFHMNDYNEIRMGNWQTPYMRRLMPHDTMTDHYAMKHWIFEELYRVKQKGLKTVVMTHHHPSFMSVPERFKTGSMSELNGCYCSEMFNDVEQSGPDLWVCGHIHDRIDYMIGNTRVVCNPRGYQQIPTGPYDKVLNEDTSFNIRLAVEV